MGDYQLIFPAFPEHPSLLEGAIPLVSFSYIVLWLKYLFRKSPQELKPFFVS